MISAQSTMQHSHSVTLFVFSRFFLTNTFFDLSPLALFPLDTFSFDPFFFFHSLFLSLFFSPYPISFSFCFYFFTPSLFFRFRCLSQLNDHKIILLLSTHISIWKKNHLLAACVFFTCQLDEILSLKFF